MCTAITYNTKDHYFVRNLDMEFSYEETVTVTPRNYPFVFRNGKRIERHYGIIGVAFVVGDYPLYYDGTNEFGLSMAGLNFPGNADYKKEKSGCENIAPFEFIPYILGQCKNLDDVLEKLANLNLVHSDFSEELPLAPLHWMIADKKNSIVVESVKEGLKIYDNPVGVLTNNPTFDFQLFNLNNYMNVSPKPAHNNFSDKLDLHEYSRGMGGMGLPGDLSSMSRFVKAVFTKMNSVSGSSEEESVSQFFHILNAVAQQRGCAHIGSGKSKEYEMTVYSSCCNMDKGIYYYTTYENSQITGVDMNKTDLESDRLTNHKLIKRQNIKYV